MSLRDTLDAARREVQDGGTVFAGKDDGSKSSKDQGEKAARSRSARGSAARAKPARDAASSVRVVAAEKSSGSKSTTLSKPRSEMSKEEKKAARSAERRLEDKKIAVRTALLNSYPEYERSQRVWWILLGVGLGLTLIAFALNWLLRDSLAAEDGLTPSVVLSITPIVLAYGCIIAAVIYDLRVGRPLRKRADAELQGMSTKRMNAVLREEEARQAEKKAKKEAKKAAKG